MLREPEVAPPPPPCARCGEPSSSDLWGMASCADCRAVWFASEKTTSGAVDKALGFTWQQGQGATQGGKLVSAKDYLNATCEEYRRLARVWSHSPKRGGA